MSPVSWQYKLKMFLMFAVCYALAYLLPNFFPLSPPSLLPLSHYDLAIPFVPWTFMVYLSDYLMIFTIIVVHKDMDSFRAFCRLAFLCLFTCGVFFMLYPTTYPRPIYPDDVNPIVHFFMNLVGTADTPNNCFPSMHVSFTGIATWSIRHLGTRRFVLYCFWALAIYISTLTTKQHYIIDIFGGLMVVAFAAIVEWAVFEKRLFRTWLSRGRA